nr:hypothetical protein [Candidatus Sigynarchaeota archaeon]
MVRPARNGQNVKYTGVYRTLEYHESIKMILGDMGIKILQVLRFGPMDMEGINFLSGVPIACVKGRIPVLKSLNLIDENGSTYCINKDGEKFLQALDAKNCF